MGFRDVIAHQYFDLDAEQALLICAWVGIEHLEGRTVGMGDHTAAIWVPAETSRPLFKSAHNEQSAEQRDSFT